MVLCALTKAFVFYFILKALFVLKIFKFLSWIIGHIEKTALLDRVSSLVEKLEKTVFLKKKLVVNWKKNTKFQGGTGKTENVKC